MHGHTNIKQKFYIRPTEGMSVIFYYLIITTNYFPTQHELIGLYNRYSVITARRELNL